MHLLCSYGWHHDRRLLPLGECIAREYAITLRKWNKHNTELYDVRDVQYNVLRKLERRA
jgi:hypothetical protein